MGWGGGRSWVSRMRTPAPPPRPAEDGLLRCKQLTVLLDWAEQFEAESRQSDEAVAFSVLLGDLNFDNCSLGKTARPPPPTHTPCARVHTHIHTHSHIHTHPECHLSTDHQQEQEHRFFSCFRDPCRLGTRREQPWALGTPGRGSRMGAGGPQAGSAETPTDNALPRPPQGRC